MPLRVGYVREHFCSPLLQYEAEDNGRTFTLVECPSGTGQIISRLTDGEIDVAIGLTNPLIAGIAKGSKSYQLVGSYVTSPLRWAVITGYDSSPQNVSDLKGTTLGTSRYGSGSHTMAYVMALEQGWPTDQLRFQVNNDIRGLLASANDGSTSAFMWEWFSTKPFADAKECRFFQHLGRLGTSLHIPSALQHRNSAPSYPASPNTYRSSRNSRPVWALASSSSGKRLTIQKKTSSLGFERSNTPLIAPKSSMK